VDIAVVRLTRVISSEHARLESSQAWFEILQKIIKIAMSEKTPRNSIQKCPLRGDILQDVQPKKLTRWLPEERTALKGLQERRQMFLLLGEFSGGQIVNVFAPNNYG
jgi:hypothetical protein